MPQPRQQGGWPIRPRNACCCSLVTVMPDSFATPWTVAHQDPLSMGFSRQDYWSGVPLPSLKNTGVGCYFLLLGIFPMQGSNLSLQHWQADSLPLSHVGYGFRCSSFLLKNCFHILCYLLVTEKNQPACFIHWCFTFITLVHLPTHSPPLSTQIWFC